MFSKWLESKRVTWSVPWPNRKGTGDEPHDGDTPPQTTPEGDYVLYHGTNMINAQHIVKARQIDHDDWHCVGVTTTPSAAQVFGCMKARKGNASVILRIVVRKLWLLTQEITREIGGSGKDQWLIRTEKMPPHAIKDIRIYSVNGDVV